MNKNYSNLKLSQALADMKLASDKVFNLGNKKELVDYQDFMDDYLNQFIPAPHILDLITIYARKVFGEEYICSNCNRKVDDCTEQCCDDFVLNVIKVYKYHSQQILSMLQEDKSNDEVCDYIIKNKI